MWSILSHLNYKLGLDMSIKTISPKLYTVVVWGGGFNIFAVGLLYTYIHIIYIVYIYNVYTYYIHCVVYISECK